MIAPLFLFRSVAPDARSLWPARSILHPSPRVGVCLLSFAFFPFLIAECFAGKSKSLALPALGLSADAVIDRLKQAFLTPGFFFGGGGEGGVLLSDIHSFRSFRFSWCAFLKSLFTPSRSSFPSSGPSSV